MAAQWNRADHYIFILSFVLLSSFFPRLISAVADWMSAILPHMVCLSANLRCRSETCCTRLTENTGRKQVAKKSPSGHHSTTLSGYIFANKAHIDKFQRVSRLGSVTARQSSSQHQPNFAALNRATITLGTGPHSSYGRPVEEGRPLYFCPVVSSSIYLFSSPNLSRRRLDVYHTSTPGVAL